MLMGAEMAYTAKDYEKALHIYKQLKDKAASMERRRLAKTGMLRSAHMLGNEEEIITVQKLIWMPARRMELWKI